MIGEYMLKGVCVGAWLIGFMAAVGIFAAIVAVACIALREIFGEDEQNEDHEGNAGGVGAGIEGRAAAGRAEHGPVDLRRERRGFGSSI